ncbi:MAG: DUF3006 domain-containing protein [Haloarculaceae archaeon]
MTSLPDGTYVAVLDCFEGDRAILLLEDGDALVGELVVETAELPPDGRHVDAVFTVALADGNPDAIDYDPAETDRRAADAQSRFDRLSERPPSDEDDES